MDYFDKGYVVHTPAWHNKATVLSEWPGSVDEAWAQGFGWEPEERVLYWSEGGELQLVPNRKALVRSDNHAFLSDVGDGFTPYLNRQLVELLEILLSQDYKVKFDSVGSSEEGRKTWAVALLDEPIHVVGDPSTTLPYCTLLNAHDGSCALTGLNVAMRTVCSNTWHGAMGEGKRSGRIFSFRHTKNLADKVEQAKSILLGARTAMADYLEMCQWLTDVQLDAGMIEEFLSEFIPMPPKGLISERVERNVEAARATFRRTVNFSEALEGVPMTGYRLFHAATEYADHMRGFRNSDTYVNRTLLRSDPLKERAVHIIKHLS